MKKAVFLLLGVLAGLASAQAQIHWGNYTQSYPAGATNTPPTVGLILALRQGNDALWSIRKTSTHFDVLTDPSFRGLRPGEIVARTTFDTARAQFFLAGVGPLNAQSFQFRLTEYPGNRVLIPWRGITQFTDSTLLHDSGLPKMGYLGGYRTSLGNMLIMDVRKTAGNQIVATTLVAWEPIRPVVTSIYTSENVDEFLKKLQYPWASVKQPTSQMSPVLTVPSTNNTLIFTLKGDIFHKEQIQYELVRNGSVYTPWRFNEYDNSFVWLKNYPPGHYVIRIRYTVQPQHIAEYRFDVAPAWYQTNGFRSLAGIFLAAVLGAALFIVLFIQQRRKTRQEQVDRTRVQLELKAIYAQLNPHFVFNALSSIQGLMNKQDLKGANNYLSDFARLLRESLNQSTNDELSLQQEIQMLDTYLKLEQLRFTFQYTIRVDATINVYETSIPTLLIQPLVENSVKHGVSSLQENGLIDISVSRLANTMRVAITDNGRGFTGGMSTGGVGLKLTQDRLDLLNSLHPAQPITLTFSTPMPGGTQATLTFTDWFL